ncbi:unnamed protein product [Arctia plantaginis]|uniref:Uncharacterized protein n=1 Tax=Arctia plantaginis TaxID=874455 RepID=A0A8S1AAF4_ARCPL|nr:unnamed protein product [Arctia plantaginis]CAB3252733.1 unnamed protein product [Arctia plantaginis]
MAWGLERLGLQIRHWVKVSAEQNGRIEYKYDLDEGPCTIIVVRTGRRNQQPLENEFELKKAYNGPLPIRKDKYKDLTDLQTWDHSLSYTDSTNLIDQECIED